MKRFGQGILQLPLATTVTEDNVFVTDSVLHVVFKFSKKDYKLVKRTGTEGGGGGQLNFPKGLCIDSTEMFM